MIKVRLAEIAEAKGHTRSTLSKETNISYPTILLFWNDTVQKIDKDILERLCNFLGCSPGDMIKLESSTSLDPLTVAATGTVKSKE